MLNTIAAEIRRNEADRFQPSRRCAYEGWTVVELKKRARQLGIERYSGLNKADLIELIRRY